MKTLLVAIFSLCVGLQIVKANPNSLPFTSNATVPKDYKIFVIDVFLGEAKSLGDIQKVLMLMNAFVVPVGDSCKAPNTLDYKLLCADIGTRTKAPVAEIEYYEYTYEKRILKLACVDVRVDNGETIKVKVQAWWNKYKTKCKCDSLEFGLSNGNLLKFALSQNFPEVIETLASTYDCDINFIDPADGMNLLDYINNEISRLKKLGNSANIVRVYEEYKDGVIGLGGKSNK